MCYSRADRTGSRRTIRLGARRVGDWVPAEFAGDLGADADPVPHADADPVPGVDACPPPAGLRPESGVALQEGHRTPCPPAASALTGEGPKTGRMDRASSPSAGRRVDGVAGRGLGQDGSVIGGHVTLGSKTSWLQTQDVYRLPSPCGSGTRGWVSLREERGHVTRPSGSVSASPKSPASTTGHFSLPWNQ